MPNEEDVTTEPNMLRYRFNSRSYGAPVNAGGTFAAHSEGHKEDVITEPNTLRNRFNKCSSCGAPVNAGGTFAAHSEGHEEGVITERNTFRNRFNKCRSCGAPVNAGGTFAAHSEGHEEDVITEPNTFRNRFNMCPSCGTPVNAGGTSAAHSEGHCSGPMTHSEGQENFDTSLSTPTLIHEYDVFVSFRGEDTRTSFTAYLLDAFDRNRIYAYKDDVDLPRGEEIETEIFNAIERSRIAVVVFSKNYTTSRWCLDELVKIMECKRRFNQRVIPVFYDVSPSMVSEQKENFAEALLNGPEDKVNIWKATLEGVANLAGLHLKPYQPEPEFIEEIVQTIWEFLCGITYQYHSTLSSERCSWSKSYF